MSDVPSDLVKTAMDRCRHFLAMGTHDTCSAGVRYAAVSVRRAPGEKGMASIPCFQKYNDLGATCPNASFLSREEAEERAREWNARFERAMLARDAIMAEIKHGGASAGSIACPTCGASLSYSRARSNGHIHARCATPKCVAFME